MRWYLEPYGSDAMDDIEARTLGSPFMQSLPAQEDNCSNGESDPDLSSAENVSERPRKRFRIGNDSFTSPITVSTVSASLSGLSGWAPLETGDKVQDTPVQHGRANEHDSVRDRTSGNLSSNEIPDSTAYLSVFPMSGQIHSVEFSPDGNQQERSEATYPENIRFLYNQVGSSAVGQPSKSFRQMYLHVDSNLSFLGSNKLGLPAGALESEESTLNIHSQGVDQDHLEPDPAIDRTLFNWFDGDPAISQTLFSRVGSDPSIEGALFTQFDSDPAITRALFSRGLAAL